MDTCRVFSRLNVRKASGPDGISSRLLKSCSDELSFIFTSIFNWSLTLCKIPQVFKKSVIVPVPKRTPVNSLNDYRPVALTSQVMKSLERIVLDYLKSAISKSLDPLQFAYRANQSIDDAVSLALHYVFKHLDSRSSTYARLLFIDFSSAFNTISPSKLYNKLIELGINSSVCSWIYDFLTDRSQVVRMNSLISNSTVTNIGAPQECVLSPLLYSLYTYDCVSSFDDCKIVKYAGDTTVVGLIKGNDEHNYRNQIQHLTQWCSDNNLNLNVMRKKEIIVNFCVTPIAIAPLVINGNDVEIVDCFGVFI